MAAGWCVSVHGHDNEWGFSSRMADTAALLGRLHLKEASREEQQMEESYFS